MTTVQWSTGNWYMIEMASQLSEERMNYLISGGGRIDSQCRAGEHSLLSYASKTKQNKTQNKSKYFQMDERPNMKKQSYKNYQKKNVGKYHCDFAVGKNFLKRKTKGLDYFKMKDFGFHQLDLGWALREASSLEISGPWMASGTQSFFCGSLSLAHGSQFMIQCANQ